MILNVIFLRFKIARKNDLIPIKRERTILEILTTLKAFFCLCFFENVYNSYILLFRTTTTYKSTTYKIFDTTYLENKKYSSAALALLCYACIITTSTQPTRNQ